MASTQSVCFVDMIDSPARRDETTRDAVSAVTDDVYSSQDYITAEVTPVD